MLARGREGDEDRGRRNRHRRHGRGAQAACREHELTVFEAADWIGGHTNTVDVETACRAAGRRHGLHRLQREDVSRTSAPSAGARRGLWKPSDMSFSVRCEDERARVQRHVARRAAGAADERPTALLLAHGPGHPALLPRGSGGARAARTTARRWASSSSAAVLARLRREAPDPDGRRGLVRASRRRCAPSRCASWCSSSTTTASSRSTTGRSGSSCEGGSREYVRRLTAPFHDRIRLRHARRARGADADAGSVVRTATGEEETLRPRRCSRRTAIRALRMLADASPVEREVLSAPSATSATRPCCTPTTLTDAAEAAGLGELELPRHRDPSVGPARRSPTG